MEKINKRIQNEICYITLLEFTNEKLMNKYSKSLCVICKK
jgi:hypothetical protein